MMAFNLFNPAQLPTGLPPATPIKSDDSNAQADALRILTSSALLGGSPMPFGGPMPLDAVRAMFPGVPFPIGLYPGPPQEFSNPGAIPPQFFDSIVGFHPYGGIDGSRRKNATRETTAPLKEWLTQHRTNPYPTKGEKVMLAVMTKMTLTQVSTWFANARRRLKKENGGSVTVKRRPEDGDDDDDMAELDRPSSSNSNGSDIKEEDVEGGENENVKEETTREQLTPKRKIFSIDDIIDSSKRIKKDEEASSSKKDSPSSEESAPSLAYPWQQQMQQFMAMCRANPQFMTGPLRPPFLPFNSLMMSMGAIPTTPTGPPLNGSFTSETTSVSPSSSHSPSAPPAEEPKSSPKAEA